MRDATLHVGLGLREVRGLGEVAHSARRRARLRQPTCNTQRNLCVLMKTTQIRYTRVQMENFEEKNPLKNVI